jgi:hypothetical protein
MSMYWPIKKLSSIVRTMSRSGIFLRIRMSLLSSLKLEKLTLSEKRPSEKRRLN